jgi:hypothetical protein
MDERAKWLGLPERNPLEVLREHLPTDYLGPDPNDMDGEKWGQHPEALTALAQVETLVEAASLLVRRDTYDMQIVAVREYNLIDALAPFQEARDE